MFKTVRAQHGAGDLAAELEYTILPQSDDRSASASSGEDEQPTRAAGRQHCGGHHRCRCQYHQHRHQHHHQHQQHQQRRQRRGSSVGCNDDDCDDDDDDCDGGGVPGTRRTIIIILVMLVLGCGVVVAAVLVPILLAARLVSAPTSARLQTFAVAASGVIHSARGDYMPLLPIKAAAPGIVINFAQERPPPPPTAPPRRPPAKRRKRRAAAARAAAAGPRRPTTEIQGQVGHRRRGLTSRLLDFRTRR